ncbi:Bcap11 [Botrytis cinerea B05.10]|uniref:Bcap11 n=1 Tax=Botryotinia fuckeliana (strain B05.10) TaxID=332648 RepID=A0A384JJJ7_BOTFB|nr:Bcap11 [Botrytis cinerea B05.10]ATZ50710.1 Bcap11 [Botrytis cinerea B05.10]
MGTLIYHTLIFLLLISLTLAQVRIPITRQSHAPDPALNRRFFTRDSVSTSLANDATQASYVISVKVGIPPQDVDLTIDTGSTDTWVILNTATSCTGVGIPDNNGSAPVLCRTPYNSSASSTVELNITTDEFNIAYVDGGIAQGPYIADTFVLGNVTIESLQIGLASDTNIQMGILGLGYSIGEASNTVFPNVIDKLVSQNLIGSRAYSLYLDSQDSATGSLLFGAVDTTKFVGELVSIDIVPQPLWNGSILYSTLSVELAAVGITDQEGNAANLTTSPQVVLLDSGTSITILPAEVTNAMFKELNAYDDTNSTGNVYLPCSLLNTSSSLTVDYSFSSSSTSAVIRVPISELVFPLTNPVYALYPEDTLPDLPFSGEACAFGIQTSNDIHILGDTFLRSAYVVYDLDNNQIGLAQANFESNSVSASSSDGDGHEHIVELKAGESIPALTGVSVTSSAEPSPSSSASKTVNSLAATATAAATRKSGDAISTMGNVDFRILGFFVLGGIFLNGAIVA